MADLETLKGKIETEMIALGLPDSVMQAILGENRDTLANVFASRNLEDFSDVMRSIEPGLDNEEFLKRFGHILEYFKAKSAHQQSRAGKIRDRVQVVRDTVGRCFEGLSDKPRSILAIRAGESMSRNNVQVADVRASAHVDNQRQAQWMEKQLMDGYQLFFASDGTTWNLIQNSTGVPDEDVMELFSQNKLKKMWNEESREAA